MPNNSPKNHSKTTATRPVNNGYYALLEGINAKPRVSRRGFGLFGKTTYQVKKDDICAAFKEKSVHGLTLYPSIEQAYKMQGTKHDAKNERCCVVVVVMPRDRWIVDLVNKRGYNPLDVFKASCFELDTLHTDGSVVWKDDEDEKTVTISLLNS